MDDAKRFFRYLVPGVVPLVELAVLLAIADHERVLGWLRAYGSLLSGFGGAALGLSVAAGFGYIFSSIHHFISWRWRRWPCAEVDHRQWLRIAQDSGLAVFSLRSDVGRPPGNLSRQGSWRVMCALWHEQVGASVDGRSRLNEKVHSRQESLTDLAQGAGAVFIGLLVALAAFAVFLWTGGLGPEYRAGIHASSIIGVALWYIHGASADQLLRHAFRLPEMVLTDHLHDSDKCPVDIWVGRTELEGGVRWWTLTWDWISGQAPMRLILRCLRRAWRRARRERDAAGGEPGQ